MAKSKKTIPFGLHLMLDMYDCDPAALNNKELVIKILDELPGMLGMRKMMEPVVMFAPANDKKDPGGYSGFVMIQESHIALHTFVKRRFVTIDVYSCKDFNTKIATEYFKEKFGSKNYEEIVETRGKNYPPENID